jgi:hypothetical protein
LVHLYYIQDPTVPKKVLVAIARNKQQRSVVTQFQLYRKQQAQAGVKKTPGARRTKAEAPVNDVDRLAIMIKDEHTGFFDFHWRQIFRVEQAGALKCGQLPLLHKSSTSTKMLDFKPE